jgi:beta-lactamase regulating signal transducer with metallopeptidase domain
MSAFLAPVTGAIEWVSRASWQASLLILVVLLLQKVLRLPPRWRFALWYLVIARLLLPAVPTSSWSMFNYAPAEPRSKAVAADYPSASPLPLPASINSATPIQATETLVIERAEPVRASTEWNSLSLLLAVWLIGIAGLGLALARQPGESLAWRVRVRPQPTPRFSTCWTKAKPRSASDAPCRSSSRMLLPVRL